MIAFMGFSRVAHVAETRSTNSTVLSNLDHEECEHLSVIVAHSQIEGRGRGGSVWVAQPGTSLTFSVVVTPREVSHIPLTWIPLVAGLAVRCALAPWIRVGLKWPNDVVASFPSPDPRWGWGPKIAGILCEGHSSGAIVVGVGINCSQTPAQLPVPWAASIASLIGESPPLGDLLDGVGDAFGTHLALPMNEVRRRYREACVMLDKEVAVSLPGGGALHGVVTGIDRDGALLIATADATERISAGEVRRVRGVDSV